MSRWKPDGRGRLEKAALELYNHKGFEATTVAEIAGRAGLTERTFYRHFADKRAVLFPSDNPLPAILADATASAPVPLPPLEVVTHALIEAAPVYEEREDLVRQRQAVIAANPELQERELAKLAALAATLTQALRERGLDTTTAALAAEIGIAAFKVAYERWINDPDEHTLAQHIRETLDTAKHLTTPAEHAAATDNVSFTGQQGTA
ncbi:MULTISPECIES: TetR/AcrR family transcriptional regulator [Arthrobacter]|uniref:TetR family transcriptional regulator n=1 Tax=Arthrobacter terricola TaxID=2547396 RepID=A0A4R5KA53_9MICC|nr:MULTISPECIES: TetR/AcrR family transcriptional regulator [Arthrobacter]MBT8163331.1 TetR/AcrR family transcriptional regulator [Arthrobacter sp. GN70]TDF90572.1 TetR family transcriptional regulator [Arthrobacter terricola]